MAPLVSILVNTFCTVVNLASMGILKSIATLLVLAIHGLSIPGRCLFVVLQHVTGILRFAVGYISELLVKLIINIASELVEILLNAVSGVAGAINSGVAGLLEMTKDAWQDTPKLLDELIQSLSGVLDSIFVVWNNFLESLRFLKEKA